MGCLDYGYIGPALLVLPLFLISIVNLFVAGPPLKSVVLDSTGADYGAKLPFLELQVGSAGARFTLTPSDEMTHFFVLTCFAPTSTAPLSFDAAVTGTKLHLANMPLNAASSKALTASGAGQQHPHTLQLLQPLLGFKEYTVNIRGSTTAGVATPLPAMEYRITYVPSRFSYTQICVRSFFTLTSVCMLVAYACAMASTQRASELGTAWMLVLLVLLIALNDPLYIVRIFVGGNQYLYCASTLGQITFSGGLFMFWLVYADGMNNVDSERGFCAFYLPKFVLVAAYVGLAATLFLAYGRVPDRLNMADTHAPPDATQQNLIWALSASVVGVGVWLCFLVSRAVYRLGWKKVEYIYTEREKSFVGITIVFVTLWLCGHLFRAFHGTRGSWMQLQLPFLTLTNSYLTLLTHAFWPSDSEKVAPTDSKASEGGERDDDDNEGGLLDDDDD